MSGKVRGGDSRGLVYFLGLIGAAVFYIGRGYNSRGVTSNTVLSTGPSQERVEC